MRTRTKVAGTIAALAVVIVTAPTAEADASVTANRVAVHCQREWGHRPGQPAHWQLICHPAAHPPVMHAPHVTASHHMSMHRLMGACVRSQSFGIDHQTYMCVQQAPRDVCESALKVHRCWWFTGTGQQLVFDWAGDVAAS